MIKRSVGGRVRLLPWKPAERQLNYSVLKAELIPAVSVVKDVSLQMTLIRSFSRF